MEQMTMVDSDDKAGWVDIVLEDSLKQVAIFPNVFAGQRYIDLLNQEKVKLEFDRECG